MSEIIYFCVGIIVGGLLVGFVCWVFWLMAIHPGCLVKIEEWVEEKQKNKYKNKYKNVAKNYD